MQLTCVFVDHGLLRKKENVVRFALGVDNIADWRGNDWDIELYENR